MSRTDKDVPFQHKEADYTKCICLADNGSYCRSCSQYRSFGPFFSSNFRKGKKAIKREGNKRARRRAFNDRYHGRCPFYDTKTVRTEGSFH